MLTDYVDNTKKKKKERKKENGFRSILTLVQFG